MVETGCLDYINYLSSNLNMHVGHRHRNLHEKKVLIHNTTTASHVLFVITKYCFQDEHCLLEALRTRFPEQV